LNSTTGNRQWRTAFICIAVIALCQLCFSYQLRFFNYFNDDFEALAAGEFFRSLYINQLSVHLPMHAILSHWWVLIAGASPTANRMFAGIMDAAIEALMFLIARRIGGNVAGLLAAALYMLLEANTWSYLNLSELPSVLFALCAVYFGLGFSRPVVKIEITRPFWFGVFLSLSFLSRFMAIPLIGCIALLPLLDSNWLQKVRRSGLPATLGFALPMAVTWLYFAAVGTFRALLFWGLLYNFTAKSQHFEYKGWIGELSMPAIFSAWILTGTSVVITVACSLMLLAEKRAEVMRAFLLCWLPALGGWIGSNPSGIDGLAFHAIPALPFLCLSLGYGATVIWQRSSFPSTDLMWLPRLAAAVGVLGAVLPFWKATVTIERNHSPDPRYEHIARIGAYIESHTKPSDSIFVFGADPLIYADAHRNSGTEFSIVTDYTRPLEARMLEELRRAKPGAVVVDRINIDHLIRVFPRVTSYIVQNYGVSLEYEDVLLPKSSGATASCEKCVSEAAAIAPVIILQGAESKNVYLVTDGKRHYIPTPATLQSLGVSNQIKSVSNSVLDAIPLGVQIPALDSPLIMKATSGQVFVLEAGKRRYVPNPQTFDALHYAASQIRTIPDDGADAIPLGTQIPSVGAARKN